MSSGTVIVLFGVALAAIWSRYQNHVRNPAGLPYPPGPPGKFLIGNLKDVPKDGNEWEKHEALSRQIGSPMVFLQVLGKKVLALNALDIANDLLNKRSLVYSDRPRLVLMKEVIGWKWNLVLKSYDEGFSEARKLIQKQLQPSMVSQLHRPTMQKEVLQFLRNLHKSPSSFLDHIKRMTSTIILMSTYGHQCASEGVDPFVQLNDDMHKNRSKRPGGSIVDLFPILRFIPAWFPGAKFKRDAMEQKARALRMREEPFRMVQEKMASGKAVPSIVSTLLEENYNQNGTGDVPSLELVQDLGGVMYSAGADTTGSALQNFFLAISRHPQFQLTAQRELDAVVGRDRLPTFDDRPSLPYIDHILLEVLRWKSVTPLGAPHSNTQDDIYQDYYIPKGTTIIANISAMLHDENMYPNPLDFNPDRFLDEKTPDPTKFLYGFGRRICPGRHFASDMLWLSMACILHTFTIDANPDAVKEEKISWSSGLVSNPTPFTCTISARFAGSQNLLG